jgi:hypothetical protein
MRGTGRELRHVWKLAERAVWIPCGSTCVLRARAILRVPDEDDVHAAAGRWRRLGELSEYIDEHRSLPLQGLRREAARTGAFAEGADSRVLWADVPQARG